MNATFESFVISRNSHYLTEYLDNFTASINPIVLNSWFHQAARLPGNWETNRNAWLQEYYQKYVPEEVRKGVDLTNQNLFPCVPEVKIPPTPAKDQQRSARLIPAIQRTYRTPAQEEINIIQQD